MGVEAPKQTEASEMRHKEPTKYVEDMFIESVWKCGSHVWIRTTLILCTFRLNHAINGEEADFNGMQSKLK